MFSFTVKNLLIYVPISVIGIWRWTYWIARKIAAGLYRPNVQPWPQDRPRPKVSLVTPVYNEDPALFDQAMRSWIDNGVDEIIAVIDKSNLRHILEYEQRYASNRSIKTKCRLIVTPKPGKRAALCDGIAVAKGDIIALVDSDTVWSHDVLEKTLPYFLEQRIGGATVAQRIQNPDTLSNILFDMLLWNRYREEVPFLLGTGHVFNTLSGRTAFYRREAILPGDRDNLHLLRHEFFFGTRGISGDDKRLTHLILQQGWHVAYVAGPVVYTSGLGRLGQFMKQRLRWTRNSWRADLRAVSQGWVWNHPVLALFMIDRFIQPFFMLIGPIVFGIALAKHLWAIAIAFLVWWTLSRFIRLYSYFRAYPKRIIYLPAWIVYTYVNALIKIYALATVIEHSWATRWHAGRNRKGLAKRYLTIGAGATGTFLVLLGINGFINYTRAAMASEVLPQQPVNSRAFNGQIDFSAKVPEQPGVPQGATLPSGMLRYTVQPGDTLTSIALQLGVDERTLKNLNGIQSPHQMSAGSVLIYFPAGASSVR